ncbi:MAG TPA: DMT family transporter [Chitinispirillaceae bacterium]|nr:DMT family transporter [Chitinispirillaceae bacterium]
MGFIYILFVVLGITTVSYLGKLSAKSSVPSFDFTIAMFAAATILGYVFSKLNNVGPASYSGELWLISIFAGIGGAAAVFLFNNAVRYGHFGYSNAIYRSSFLIPVILSIAAFKATLTVTTIIGILSILVSIFLVSWSNDTFKRVNGKNNITWFFMILCAFIASGSPRIGQLLISYKKLNSSAYLFASYAAGFILLLLCFLFRRKQLNIRALFYGSIAALASFAGVYFTIEALKILPAAIVFPLTLSVPILLGMLISFIYKENIRPAGWVGVALGVFGILILSFQTYR